MCISSLLDLPDRSGVFYVVHPPSWSTANIREFFQPWNLLSYDRHDAKTHIVGMPLLKETTETRKNLRRRNPLNRFWSCLVLAKMRATDRNLIITSYAEFHRLDVSKIKTKEPNHLFDVDPANRKSTKRTYVDKDAVESMEVVTPDPVCIFASFDEADFIVLSSQRSSRPRKHPCLNRLEPMTMSPQVARAVQRSNNCSSRRRKREV